MNGDDVVDMVCQFEDDLANWSASDDEVTLSGATFDGSEFMGSEVVCM